MSDTPRPIGEAQAATRILRQAIIECRLHPAEKLSEGRLANDHGIGRGALRAALRALQEAGLVHSLPRSGWQVTPVSASEIREVCAARRHLEPILTGANLDELALEELRAHAERHAALLMRFGQDADASPPIRAAERAIIDSVARHLDMGLVESWLHTLWDKSVRLVNYFEQTSPARYTPAPRARLVQALAEGRREEALEHLAAANRALEAWLLEQFLHSTAAVQAPARRRSPPQS